MIMEPKRIPALRWNLRRLFAVKWGVMVSSLALMLAMQSEGQMCPCCSFNEFAKEPEFMAMHPLKEPTGWTNALGEMTDYKTASGKETSGFWVPPTKGSTASIVMIHEFWGLNDHIKETAEWLNKETGYGVLAVDMYEGKVAKESAMARKYMSEVKQAHGDDVVAGAVQALRDGSLAKSKFIGTVGFCFGGGWSHRTAIAGGDDVDACAIYYGMPSMDQAELKAMTAPVLMVWPNKDQWINKSVVDNFKTAMSKAGRSLQVLEYDANHAFANPSNARYNKTAADDAWAKTIAFFKKNFR